jgi:hypothetical protein
MTRLSLSGKTDLSRNQKGTDEIDNMSILVGSFNAADSTVPGVAVLVPGEHLRRKVLCTIWSR